MFSRWTYSDSTFSFIQYTNLRYVSGTVDNISRDVRDLVSKGTWGYRQDRMGEVVE